MCPPPGLWHILVVFICQFGFIRYSPSEDSKASILMKWIEKEEGSNQLRLDCENVYRYFQKVLTGHTSGHTLTQRTPLFQHKLTFINTLFQLTNIKLKEKHEAYIYIYIYIYIYKFLRAFDVSSVTVNTMLTLRWPVSRRIIKV